MAQFFFHLATPGSFDVDEEGVEFANVEEAYLDAYKAALEISIEMLRQRSDPGSFRFEICDENGTLLLELPFSEVMRPAARIGRLPRTVDVDRVIDQQSRRNATLRKELSAQFVEAFGHIQAARSKLGLPHRAPRLPLGSKHPQM